MNMDGTSLGFPIMVLFVAQASEFDISAGKQITLGLLAMVCSLGTAPIPSAELGFALIAVFDWFVDRVETAQNVTSDSFICGILNHYFKGESGPLTCCMRGIVPEDLPDSPE